MLAFSRAIKADKASLIRDAHPSFFFFCSTSLVAIQRIRIRRKRKYNVKLPALSPHVILLLLLRSLSLSLLLFIFCLLPNLKLSLVAQRLSWEDSVWRHLVVAKNRAQGKSLLTFQLLAHNAQCKLHIDWRAASPHRHTHTAAAAAVSITDDCYALDVTTIHFTPLQNRKSSGTNEGGAAAAAV